MNAPRKVLLVEDSPTDATLIQHYLARSSDAWSVTRVDCLSDAKRESAAAPFDVAVIDLNLPDSCGLETFVRLKRHCAQMPIVILSGDDNQALASEAVRLGAQDYLVKGEMNVRSIERAIRYAIERTRRLAAERELRAAGLIQRNLLPRAAPSLEGFEVHGMCRPVENAGGDLFDYIPMNHRKVGIALGDVSGHDAAAALIMAETRAVLRTLAKTVDSVGEILTEANQIIQPDFPGGFVVLFLASIDVSSGELHYASAGHFGLLVSEAGDLIQMLQSPDPPLGINRGREYQTGTHQLGPGDGLLLVTDGITQSQANENAQFGTDGVVSAYQEVRQSSARDIVDHIYGRSHDHSGAEPIDDMTIVFLRRSPSLP